MSQPDPIQTFLIEAEDLLNQIEEVVLELGQRPGDTEAINRMFRAFHTLKGSGAMFGFEAVAGFTHHVETVLDHVRNGHIAIDQPLLALILSARDQIKLLLENPDDDAVARECARIIAALQAFSPAAQPASPVALSRSAESPGSDAVAWRICFQPAAGIAASGLDPASLLIELAGLGKCAVTADSARVPDLTVLQPEQCHLAWEIVLTTARGLDAIKDVFIFVADDSKVVIDPAANELPAASPQISSAPLPAPAPAATPARKAPVVTPKRVAKEASVRVPSGKLDRLVNLVGELVMNQSRLAQVSARLGDSDLAVPVEAIERLIAELRDSVLGIRMMPIGSTFGRFKRLVHDLSHELGKEIELVTEGAETELDKNVLDQLGDPLVHLIRNSIDHGIEQPDARARAGKSRIGAIRLTATHAGSHVVVAIQDDGRGLDVDAIRAKAIERNLIPPDANLSEKDIFNLIFLPGFSTAKQVTNVSGRGVGMDVVKKQLDALQGGIHIASQRGLGTTISLTLPLTLAIVDGLLVELGGDHFIVPMSAVTENVELLRADRRGSNGRNLINVRGELVPYLRLREIFAMGGPEPEREKIVIVRYQGERVGLVVDRVLGNHQTVIQSLGRFYRDIEVCSGATIMGDGRVALILDVPGLVNRANLASARAA
jgi:two-component system, chemotaxis family, sensor kinase CheA